MRFEPVQRILGVLLMVFSTTMLPPLLISLSIGDGTEEPFIIAFAIIFGSGALLWFPVRRIHRELRTRDGFLITAMFWVVLGLSGALPFMLARNPHMPFVDAVFESISGLTTTGATVLTGIDSLPKSILYYRQQLHFFGGMGIIVLAVAILPMLGVGGMQLYRAETPGPIKDKLTPRITETAKALWYIYLGLNVACALAYWGAGMSLFDAIGSAFATLSTGGFSVHDASFGYYHSPLINMIGVVFMVLAGTNFALHFMVWRGRSLRPYLKDPEFRFYIGVLVAAAGLTTAVLIVTNFYAGATDALDQAIFQVVSFATNTGLTTTNYYAWPRFLPVLLFFLSIMGGCAGSTAGGIKMIRILLLGKQGWREGLKLIHPQAQIPVKLGRKPVGDTVMDAVWGFFAAYVATFVIIMMLVMATGVDQVTAFSTVASCMDGLGPGLGDAAINYGHLPTLAKWFLSLAMLMGRLEIFTFLVLFSPTFWRR